MSVPAGSPPVSALERYLVGDLPAHMSDAVILTDTNLLIVEYTGRAEQIYGWTRDEVLGKSLRTDFTTEYPRGDGEAFRASLAAGRECRASVRAQRKDTTWIDLDMVAVPLRDSAGALQGWMSVARDMTAEVAAMAALAESQDRLRRQRDLAQAVLDTMAQGLTISDTSSRFVYVNPAFSRMLGYPTQELVGHMPDEFTDPEAREQLLEGRQRRKQGEVNDYRSRLLHRDGHRVDVLVAGAPILDEGVVAGSIAVITDLTRELAVEAERLSLQQQIQQAQKQASLGTMAGGIAHHFNNQLLAIGGFLQLALLEPSLSHEVGEYIRRALGAVERASEVSRQLRAYTGTHVLGKREIALGTAVEHVMPLIRTSLPSHVALAARIDDRWSRVHLDEGSVEQVVTNLVTNAREAIGEKTGAISVTVWAATEASVSAELREALAQRPGPLVCLEVRDTGHGMDADTVSRAFDPFFSTRMTGRGLGLAVTQGIVKAAGGAIRIESTPGHGTSVLVCLPVVGTRP